MGVPWFRGGPQAVPKTDINGGLCFSVASTKRPGQSRYPDLAGGDAFHLFTDAGQVAVFPASGPGADAEGGEEFTERFTQGDFSGFLLGEKAAFYLSGSVIGLGDYIGHD